MKEVVSFARDKWAATAPRVTDVARADKFNAALAEMATAVSGRDAKAAATPRHSANSHWSTIWKSS